MIYFKRLIEAGFLLEDDGYSDDDGIRVIIYNLFKEIDEQTTITATYQYKEGNLIDQCYCIHNSDATIEFYPQDLNDINNLISILINGNEVDTTMG